MGPLFFRAENLTTSRTRTSRNPPLQWGRSFSERRTRATFRAAAGGPLASMGPLFFRAENVGVLVDVDPPTQASMGPLFFRAENWGDRLPLGVNRPEASMGPLFFRAENRNAGVIDF